MTTTNPRPQVGRINGIDALKIAGIREYVGKNRKPMAVVEPRDDKISMVPKLIEIKKAAKEYPEAFDAKVPRLRIKKKRAHKRYEMGKMKKLTITIVNNRSC